MVHWATRENIFSMITREITNDLTLTRTNIHYILDGTERSITIYVKL